MSHRTRREFLENSMLATAAAVAASNGVPLSANECSQSKSANEKLGVAVLGVRGRGNSHIGAFAHRHDTEILYLCDPDREVGAKRVAEVAKKQGRAPKWVADLRVVMNDPAVDIVTIATPNHWHALAAIWAMQAGKDVYVEKPVSHNVSEGRRMVQAARKYQAICQSGMQSRSNVGMQEAIAFVQNGGIGKVSVARGICFKPRGSIGERKRYSLPENVDYGLWLGPAEVTPVTRKQFHYDWQWQWAYGNGELGNQAVHQMDIARWGLGVAGLSDTVMSYGGRFHAKDAGDTPNTQVVTHNFGERSLVLECRGLRTRGYQGAKVGVIFAGSEGYVVMSSYSSGAAFDRDGKSFRKFSGGGDHFQNFLTAVRSRKQEDLNADIEEGHYSSALCHTGNISYRLGSGCKARAIHEQLVDLNATNDAKETLQRTLAHLQDNGVDLGSATIQLGAHLVCDSKAENFPGNDAANEMLARSYREPYTLPNANEV